MSLNMSLIVITSIASFSFQLHVIETQDQVAHIASIMGDVLKRMPQIEKRKCHSVERILYESGSSRARHISEQDIRE